MYNIPTIRIIMGLNVIFDKQRKASLERHTMDWI